MRLREREREYEKVRRTAALGPVGTDVDDADGLKCHGGEGCRHPDELAAALARGAVNLDRFCGRHAGAVD